MANALTAAGIRRGDAVAIALPNGLPAIVSFSCGFHRGNCGAIKSGVSL